MSRTRVATLVAFVAIVVALVPGIATVAHNGTGGTTLIHACANPTTKVITIASSTATAKCPVGQTPLHWAKKGPKGSTGPKGDTGARGAGRQ